VLLASFHRHSGHRIWNKVLDYAAGAAASRICLRIVSNQELPGILQWAIEGWLSLQAVGKFVQPDASGEIARELQNLSSPIGVFVSERCEVAATCSVNVDDLFKSWRNSRIRREGSSSRKFPAMHYQLRNTFSRGLLQSGKT